MKIIFLIFCGLASLMRAEVSLDAAFAAALTRSEALAGQQELLQQAREHVSQARGSIGPKLDLLGQSVYSSEISGQPKNTPVFKVTANQPLFRGGREYSALDATERLVDAQGEAIKQFRVQIYADMVAVFYTVLSAEADMKNLDEEADFFERRLKELGERVTIGRSQKSEVLSVQSAKATLDAQRSQVAGAAAVAREAFSFLSGLPSDSALADLSATADSLPDLMTQIKLLESRPDLRAASLRVDFAKASLEITQGAHWPNIDLNADYYYLPAMLATDDSNGLWDFQIVFSLPLFNGFQNISKTHEARSMLAVANLELGRLRRQAEHEIRSTLLSLESDLAQVSALKTAVEASRLNYKEQAKKYNLGLVTNLDVIQALISQADNQRSLDRAIFTTKSDLGRLRAVTAQIP